MKIKYTSSIYRKLNIVYLRLCISRTESGNPPPQKKRVEINYVAAKNIAPNTSPFAERNNTDKTCISNHFTAS